MKIKDLQEQLKYYDPEMEIKIIDSNKIENYPRIQIENNILYLSNFIWTPIPKSTVSYAEEQKTESLQEEDNFFEPFKHFHRLHQCFDLSTMELKNK